MDFDSLIDFVREHRNEDPIKLLLRKNRYPGVDVEFAVQQIEGMRQAPAKWPTLASYGRVLYPPRLNREQSSSEATADHKAEILRSLYGNSKITAIADLTGGMGVDTMAFAKLASRVDYVERDETLCRLMRHNAAELGLTRIDVHCADSMEWLAASDRHYDVIFIDPARRDSHGRKVAAFEECVPNIMEHKELLLSRCDTLMVKASPMMDIDKGIEQLGQVGEVYVVAVEGECKELLFLCEKGFGETVIHCRNIVGGKVGERLGEFTRRQESAAQATYCGTVGAYIFEPDASLMKGAPFKLISERFGLRKLSRNTHLYTGDTLVDWPGRVFRVMSEVSPSKKNIAAQLPEGKAHVVVRNYPATAVEVQRQTGLSEGGDLFVVATTVGVKKTAFICSEEKIIHNF